MYPRWKIVFAVLGLLIQPFSESFAEDVRLETGCYFVAEHAGDNCITVVSVGPQGSPYCLRPMPIVTAANFKKVELNSYTLDGKQEYNIGITLDEIGRERFSAATGSYIGKRIAMVVDGKIVMAPIVKAKIESGRLQLNTLHHSREELLGLYECLRKQQGSE